MTRVRDRTEDFKDAVRHTAASLGYNEQENIGTLEQFIIKHRKDYVDLHQTTEQERDSTEHEVELTSLLDSVQQTETKMVEMSALNHLMSTHVLKQAQQIELLYEQNVIFLVNLGLKRSTKSVNVI
ncbi:hypothetical protein GH714_036719 [Hevea brasiliensis]|uniref:Uncharacterized protein n=1 Tax=Hevea brasiliensis TaxID=3981 RepID=A0A6A6L817_HEVBR|nr:hypothetical protein GH714_036719 [Hevea brasiliensis]